MAISVPPKGDADKKIGAHMAPLSVQAQDTPNMTVKIRAGWFYNTNGDAMEYSGGNSPTITPPGANAKWVIVAINNSASIVLVNGTAAASPTLPALPAGYTPLAFVYVPSTATTLTNEKIFDARPFLRGIDIVPNLATELSNRPTFTDMNNALDTKADNSGTPDFTFYLNNDDAPASDAMYAVKRGASPDVAIRWNETLDVWQFTNDGVTFVNIASVSGTFMPLVPLAVSGNVATFNGVGEVQDSGVAVGDFATDAEVTAAVAAHAADAVLHLTPAQNTLLDGLAGTLTAAELNFVDGVTSAIQPQLDSKATDTLVVHLAGVETITGVKTFTASPVFQSATDSFITFNKGATDDAGIHVNRGVDPIAAVEWDETTDQWMAGTLGGGMFPILTAENLALADLTDVSNTLAPALNDVLRYNGVEWTSNALADKVDVAGDTMTGALVLAAGTAAAPSLSFTGDLTKGLYDSGAGQVSVAIAGAEKIRIDAGGITTFSGYAQGSAAGMALWNTATPTVGVTLAGGNVAMVNGAGSVTVGPLGVTLAGTVSLPGGSALSAGDIGTLVQAADADLTAVAAISAGDGLVRRSGGVWSVSAEPVNQIVYGTGTDVDSDADFTYVASSGQFRVNTTDGTNASVLVATPGNIGIIGAAAVGTGVNGGSITIAAGRGGDTSGNGGSLTLRGGSGDGDGAGGTVSVIAGNGAFDKNGGDVVLTAGNNQDTLPGAPGNIDINAGNSTISGAAGGNVTVDGGAGNGAAAGGNVTVTSGVGGLTGAGGTLALNGAAGGATSGNGGDVSIASGTATVGDGGDIALNAGNGSVNGGSITIVAGTGATVGTIQLSASFAVEVGTDLKVGGSAGTAGQTLRSAGAAAAPAWTTMGVSEASFAFTFGAIATNDVGDSTNTMTLTGAVVGDAVAIAPATMPVGFTYQAWVSAADTVTVRAHGSASSGTGAGAANVTMSVVALKTANYVAG